VSGYVKALAAVVVSLLGALVVALGTGATDFGDISTKNWLIAIGAVIGSGGMVYLTENGPAAPAIKAVMAFLGGGIASLVIALDDDVLTRAEQLTALAAAIVATGFVYQLDDGDHEEPPPPLPPG
jgi:peptidoglycan/LPS O-acetylase OafA/YrhL